MVGVFKTTESLTKKHRAELLSMYRAEMKQAARSLNSGDFDCTQKNALLAIESARTAKGLTSQMLTETFGIQPPHSIGAFIGIRSIVGYFAKIAISNHRIRKAKGLMDSIAVGIMEDGRARHYSGKKVQS